MTPVELTLYIACPIAGYLLGSIPFAWVIGKFNGTDIRTVGSKNIGATNLGRTLGPRFFWYAFILDALKGFLPTLLVSLFVHHHNEALLGAYNGHDFDLLRAALGPPSSLLPTWAPLVTAAACVVGHLFPIWLNFKGGKGVATGFGVVLGFWPIFTLAGLAAAAFFVFMLMIYRYISLASMSGSLCFAILVAVMASAHNQYFDLYQEPPDRYVLISVACLFALMIIVRHRANITRLMKGTEPQIGQKEIDKAKMQGP